MLPTDNLVDPSWGKHDGGQRQQTVSLQQQAAQRALAAWQQHLSAGETGLEEQPGIWRPTHKSSLFVPH